MIVNSLKEWKALCTLFLREPYIAVDVETYAPDVPEHGKLAKNQALIKDRARITTISVCTSFGSFVIGTDRLSTELSHLPASKVIRMMRPVLESPEVIKAFHNASYDVGVFSYAGVNVENYVCTMLMGAVQDTNIKKGLKVRALGVGMYLHKIDSNKDLVDFLTYADEDALACYRLYEAYKYGKLTDAEDCYVKASDIEAMKLEKWQRYFVYHQEFPVLKTMLRAEKRGIQIDVDYLRELEKHTKFRREEVLKQIYKYSDRVFNIDSPKQLAWFLFEHLELKSPFLTPTGAQSGDKKALFYMKNAHPVIDKIIEYRGINTLLKNYINTSTGIVAFTDRDFVVHCSINTHQAITGRFSVTNPALQTIPREDTVKRALGEGHSIRKAFIARPGYKLVALDYSQIELRLIAVYSKEKAMIEVLNDGGDIHQLTADRCGVPRQIAKNLNFGLCYGMGPWKLADMLTMEGNPTTEHQAKIYHNAYHEAYPGIKRLHNALVAEHNSRGYITCITGRRRHIPELLSNNKKDFSAGRRIAANNTIQISAGDLLKQSVVRIEDDPNTRKRDIHTLLQIHDELLFEVPENDVEEHKDFLQGKMQMLPDRLQRPITVPIVAEGHYGDNWAECK